MNEANHHKVVSLAVPALPSASRAFWAPLASQISATCMLPDQFAIPLLNGEDGHWRHYFPAEVPLHSFEKLGAAARAHFFDLPFYVSRIMALMAAGELAEACRFLGVFSHHLGDFSEPAHYYEYEITMLRPPPPDRVNCNSHRMIEDTRSTVTQLTHQPQVLGQTPETVLMRLEGRLRELYELTLGTIIPMLDAIYQRDAARAGELVNPVVAGTAAIMADLLHTLYCWHHRQWTAAESQALATCRLDLMEPSAYDVEYNYGCRPIRGALTIDRIGRALPLALRLPTADGLATQLVDGLCLVPHALPIKAAKYLASVDFDLPPGAFQRLTTHFGLLAEVTPQAPCRFVIEADGVTLHESPMIAPGEPGQSVTVPVAGRRRLRLVVHTDGSTDKLAYPIWAWPTLDQGAVPAAG
jgi:hypothetical protein